MGFGIPDFIKDRVSDAARAASSAASAVVDNGVTRGFVSTLETVGTTAQALGGVLNDAARQVAHEVSEVPGQIHRAGLIHSGLYRAADGIAADTVAEAQEPDGFDPLSLVASGGIRILQGVSDDIIDPLISNDRQTIGYDQLDPNLQTHVEDVFGDSVDMDDVQFIQGGTSTNLITAHVVGNTVYLPDGALFEQADGTFAATNENLIAHELGHVWQNQNGGGDFAHQALYHQAVAALPSVNRDALGDLGDLLQTPSFLPGSEPSFGEIFDDLFEAGNRNDAYRGAEAITAGTAFADLNPEEQADVIDHLARMDGMPTVNNIPYQPDAASGRTAADVVADWEAALASIQNGEHAP